MKIDLQDIIDVVREAGQLSLRKKKKKPRVRIKANNTPVTEADLAVNDFLIERLSDYGFPTLSEERADRIERLDHATLWIIDPIDGTSHYVAKRDDFAVSVGLVKDRQPILGVVYAPVEDVLYFSEAGQGAYRQLAGQSPERIHVSDRRESDSVVVMPKKHFCQVEQGLVDGLGTSAVIKRGSFVIKACLIAEGSGDLYVNPTDETSEWDLCAVDVILSEAGGRLTDMDGGGFMYNKSDVKNHRGVVLSNGQEHDRVLQILNTMGL